MRKGCPKIAECSSEAGGRQEHQAPPAITATAFFSPQKRIFLRGHPAAEPIDSIANFLPYLRKAVGVVIPDAPPIRSSARFLFDPCCHRGKYIFFAQIFLQIIENISVYTESVEILRMHVGRAFIWSYLLSIIIDAAAKKSIVICI